MVDEMVSRWVRKSRKSVKKWGSQFWGVIDQGDDETREFKSTVFNTKEIQVGVGYEVMKNQAFFVERPGV